MSKFDNETKEPEMGYFNLINSILDVVVELNTDLITTYISRQVHDLFGYSPEELIGKRYIDFIHPNDISKIKKAIRKTTKTGEVISEEFRIQHKKGHYIPVSARGCKVEYNNQVRIIAVFRDIKEEKQAQQRLKEMDKRYREIIENIEDGYFEVDLQGNYTYVNAYICRYLGFSKKELIGKSYTSKLNKNTYKEIYEIFNNVYNNNLPKGTFVSRVIRRDGKERTFEGTFYIKYDFNGRKVGFYGFTRDVTEQKLVEKKIQESEKKFRTIFKSIPDLFFLVDKDSIILEYSGKQEDLYIPPEQFLGKKMINLLPSDVGELCKEAINKTLNSEKPQIVEYNLLIESEIRHFEARYLLFAENKVAIFIRNITEKKESEQKLKESEEKYRAAYNRAELYKDLFYHDINNILSNIKLSIDLSETYLNKPEKENEIKDLYILINKQFARGTRLIANVHKLSLLDKSLKSIDAIKQLEDANNFIRTSMQTRNINININSFEEKVLIQANEFLIDVFDNLLINAVNYNDNPKVEISIKISRMPTETINCIKFEIKDNGIGISDKRKEVIFQEGFSKEKGTKGMGFGLTLVKKIIESYKGEIWIEDRVKGDYSQGSNVVFLIPEAT